MRSPSSTRRLIAAGLLAAVSACGRCGGPPSNVQGGAGDTASPPDAALSAPASAATLEPNTDPPPPPAIGAADIQPRRLQPGTLRPLPAAWSRATSGVVPVLATWGGASPSILAADVGTPAALVRLDPLTGKPVARHALPPGVQLGRLLAAAPPHAALVVAVGHEATGATHVTRLREDLSARWSRPVAQGYHEVTVGPGIELFERQRCESWLIDPEAGGGVAGPFAGYEVERIPHEKAGVRGPATRSCHDGLSVEAAASGLTIALRRNGSGTAVEAIDVAADAGVGTPRWSMPIDGIIHAAHADAATATFATTAGDEVIQLDLATGRVAWRTRLPLRCQDGTATAVPHAVPLGDGRPALLVQDCTRAVLVDLASGKVLWQRRVDDATAILTTEKAERRPLHRAVDNVIAWFRPDGTPEGRVALKSAATAFFPVPEGIVVETLSHESIALVRRDGTIVWQLGIESGNSFTAGDFLVLLANGVQVLVDPRSGKAWGLPFGSPFVLGVVDTTLITTRDLKSGDREIVGVVLPPR